MNIEFSSVINLLHSASYGSLATHSVQLPGYPFASILPFVLDAQHAPVFLISTLAEHTRNVLADGRASFLVHGAEQHDILASERVSLLGDVARIEASPALVRHYLRAHPSAEPYLGLGDFAFFRLLPQRARYIGGFGRMGWVGTADWEGASVLGLDDAEVLLADSQVGKPLDVRLLGLDCFGFDLERAGKRERQRYEEGPVSADRIGETLTRYLAAM
ncbi:MAG: pyridoxamine 5-phosphate oxidase [Herminiimonas sp.]|nr:pyridoxamine 5-phosphate oxidase [Herminiimonas sp.]MDB5854166.1 pyridoxamine 5-phosphate oxidase [Herminiimonas sp.]